jgi:hypothetical protein
MQEQKIKEKIKERYGKIALTQSYCALPNFSDSLQFYMLCNTQSQ